MSSVAVHVSEELMCVCVSVGDSCPSGMHEVSFSTGSGGWCVCAAPFLAFFEGSLLTSAR